MIMPLMMTTNKIIPTFGIIVVIMPKKNTNGIMDRTFCVIDINHYQGFIE